MWDLLFLEEAKSQLKRTVLRSIISQLILCFKSWQLNNPLRHNVNVCCSIIH